MWKIIILFFLSCVFAQEAKGDEDNIKIGHECELQEDCENIKNAICDFYDTCECAEGYWPSPDKSTCLRFAAKIGDECQISEQCSPIFQAECKNKTCVVTQAVTTSPVTAEPTRAECTEDSQCSNILVKRVCKNGTCVLALPSVATNVGDFDVFLLGKLCFNDSDCSGENAACIDKLCKCKEGFLPAQNLKMCLPKAKSVGDRCTENAQCLSLNGSVCENEKCTQMARVLTDIREKISSLLIGSTCQDDNQCKHMNHTLCLESVCQCKENYVTSITSDSCLEKAKKEGDPCDIDKQCEDIKGATCVQHKCLKPGVVGTKLGKENSGSTNGVSKFALAVILFVKLFSV